MPRKSTVILDYKLRIREGLRRQIEQAAKKRGVSLNAEMAWRLERSFSKEAEREIDEIRSDLAVVVDQLGATLHPLNKQGDALRALGALIDVLPADVRARTAVRRAVAEAEKLLEVVAAEGAELPRRMHTTGALSDKPKVQA